ncbi:MAG: Uronate isomerase [Ignavibacteriae bacterium]|nr:MAG: Uronate isomerase [Ignavibacteriota bacterium]
MKDIFITENFLLNNNTAIELYNRFAKDKPIIDYHCHLPPELIANNYQFKNITEVWLAGDHYKWRAMRTAGIDEKYITGNATDWQKFQKWASVVPKTIRNPLYHWTHMELKKPFGISDVLLNEKTARYIWDVCNEKLKQKDFTARGLIEKANVEVVCTTDDPVDELEFHKILKKDKNFKVKVIPAFRADKALNIERGEEFLNYLKKLSKAANVEINSFQQFIRAIEKRHRYFHKMGCRLSDHGLETVYVENYTEKEIEQIFSAALKRKVLDFASISKFKSAVLYELCRMDAEKGWVQQFHLGALRNTNPKMYKKLGPDTGYDSIGEFPIAQPLIKLFARLDSKNLLAKTIIYNLNPAQNEVVATLIGNFQDGKIAGKIQFGSAWWFLDQKDGIEKQINSLSNMGLLSQFVGMLTDSRSFLSYSRHEYFRRILCNVLGEEMEKGLIPNDITLVGQIIEDVCYNNARHYFDFFEN